jgi:transcriptional regulator with XRE-family HTH domain
MHIGRKIKIARIAKGLTQEGLAEKINKTRPLVSHIEQTGLVNSHTLDKICQVLDVNPADLQNEVSEPGGRYRSERSNTAEIKRLREEIATLKELISMQKEVITELKAKLSKKKAGK